MRHARFALATSTAFALALTFSTAARADDEPLAADVAAARALGQEGVKLADAGNCVEAIDRLARAEKMYHAPTTLARLGECQVQVGKLVDGTENLNRVVREVLAPGAPPAYTAAQERAKKLLAEAKGRIANLKIAVAAPPEAQVVVKVDGKSIPLANLNTNRPIDPGEHVIEASAPGYKPATAKVTLAESGVDSVALTLEIDPNAPPADESGASPTSATGGSTAASSSDMLARPRTRIPAYVALGVGAAGVGVGTVFGLMASGKKNDLDSACPNKVCTSDAQNTIDSGKTYGTISTVSFIVGGVGLAAGAYLFLTSGARETTATATGPTVTPFVGLGGGGVAGRF